jgi:hypothetical protein
VSSFTERDREKKKEIRERNKTGRTEQNGEEWRRTIRTTRKNEKRKERQTNGQTETDLCSFFLCSATLGFSFPAATSRSISFSISLSNLRSSSSTSFASFSRCLNFLSSIDAMRLVGGGVGIEERVEVD